MAQVMTADRNRTALALRIPILELADLIIDAYGRNRELKTDGLELRERSETRSTSLMRTVPCGETCSTRPARPLSGAVKTKCSPLRLETTAGI